MTARTDPIGPAANGGLAAPEALPAFALPLAPPLERRRLQAYLTLIVCDTIGIIAAFLSLAQLDRHAMDFSQLDDLLLLFIPLYWIVALALGVYAVRALISVRHAQVRVTYALMATVSALVLVFYLAHSSLHYARLFLGLDLLACIVTLTAVRSALRPLVLRRCGPTAENVLVIDDGGGPVRVPGAWLILAHDHHLRPDYCDPHMLDLLGLFMTNMDRVLVTCPPERRAAWAMVFKGSNVCGEIVDSDVLTLGVLGARRASAFGTLVVSVGPLSLQSRAIKRAVDLAIAIPALLFLAPLMVVVAALIYAEDGGPILFRQQRQGRSNRLFWIYKFRSMRAERHDAAGTRSASRDDERITRIGALLRRSSIDELPQLFNVLRGEMSIVGPRPHAIGSLAGTKRFWEVDPRYLLRHALKPGLTGLAQMRGLRGATDTEADLRQRLQADLEYLDGWTIRRDLRIILGTIRVLIHDRAY
jgi:lipopolysaccharide/colanic/teichoic acid biosynthesis glycosyltransferase